MSSLTPSAFRQDILWRRCARFHSKPLGSLAGCDLLCREILVASPPFGGTGRGGAERSRCSLRRHNIAYGTPAWLCHDLYRVRGRAENLIKRHKSQRKPRPANKECEHGNPRYASLYEDSSHPWIRRDPRRRVWHADPRSSRDQTSDQDRIGSGIPAFRLRGTLPQ